jgi:nucleoid-associated protein YgaU
MDPTMRVRWLLPAVLLAALATACVPTPASRLSPTADSAQALPTPLPTPAGPTPTPSFVRPTPTPGPTFALYTVKRGDTLVGIAKTFKTDGRSIAYWNRVTYPSLDPDSIKYKPDRIEVGWVLQILPGETVDPEAIPELTPRPTPRPTLPPPSDSPSPAA